MIDARGNAPNPLLHAELRWLVRLRWVAAGVILAGALAQWRWLGWYERTVPMLAVGLGLAAFNAAIGLIARRLSDADASRRALRVMAWAQILFDLACLSLLAVCTGGLASPLLGFYVFHMLFASLLLSRRQAYAAAAAGTTMFFVSLRLWGPWPSDRSGALVAAGWIGTLLVTVYLTSRIARGLYSRERQRRRQGRRLRAMSARLGAQRRAMIQHEKLVAMGQLAAGVAHEIGNPLASMDGVLQLMQRNSGPARPEAVAVLREQVERIHRTVRQLTAFAHPDKGVPELTDVNELIRGHLKMLGFDHRLRQVRVELDLAQHVGRIRVVARALQQALTNLVLNALDAMAGTPSPRLVVRTRRQYGHCTIEVADNGHGIPADVMGRLFEPFFTTKPVGKGTGLGLSISRSLVGEQGGVLDVTSEPGSGATFTIRLPAAEAEPEPGAMRVAGTCAAEPAGP